MNNFFDYLALLFFIVFITDQIATGIKRGIKASNNTPEFLGYMFVNIIVWSIFFWSLYQLKFFEVFN